MQVPDSLAQRIALFRDDAYAYQAADELFRVDSWVQVMLGQRLEPRGRHAIGRMMGAEQMRGALGSIAGQIEAAVAKLPQHQAFLDAFCGPAAGTPR
jgi:tryptophan halogenase